MKINSQFWPAGSTAAQIQEVLDATLGKKGLLTVVGVPVPGGKDQSHMKAELQCPDDISNLIQILWLAAQKRFCMEIPGSGGKTKAASFDFPPDAVAEMKKSDSRVIQWLEQIGANAGAAVQARQPEPLPAAVALVQPEQKRQTWITEGPRTDTKEHEFRLCFDAESTVRVLCEEGNKINLRFEPIVSSTGSATKSSVQDATFKGKSFRIFIRLVAKPQDNDSANITFEAEIPQSEEILIYESKIW